MENQPTCKSCKHCRADWFSRTFNINSFVWQCGVKIKEGKTNYVTGQYKPGDFPYCSEMRSFDCGHEAKFWSPRNTKKFLFTLLSKP